MKEHWREFQGTFRRQDGAVVMRLNPKSWGVQIPGAAAFKPPDAPEASLEWLRTKNGNKKSWKTAQTAMTSFDRLYPYGYGFGTDGDVVISKVTLLTGPLHAATLTFEPEGVLLMGKHPVYVLEGGHNLEQASDEALEELSRGLLSDDILR